MPVSQQTDQLANKAGLGCDPRRCLAAVSLPQGPRPASLGYIRLRALQGARQSGVMVLFAGKPAGKGAPNGMAEILKLGGHSSLGVSGGLTLIKNSAAFVPPEFKLADSTERTAQRVAHYAVVERTRSQDAEHESYYPLPGNHLRPGMTQAIDGKTFNHYWTVSPRISELIRQGEQEHLDDARRAYELTYKLVETQINAMAGRRFGPADSAEAARRLTEVELEKRLPRQLGTDPSDWDRVLDELLAQTVTRDKQQWHALSIDPEQTTGNQILHPVATTPKTRIGHVASREVVHY